MEKAKPTGAKRTKKIVEAEGIAHITATFNNTLITITDMQGNGITWGSSGKAGFAGSKKSTPFAATVAAEQAAREAMNLGVRRVHVRVQGPRVRHSGTRDRRLADPIDPRRHADSAQRVPAAQEAAGLACHATRGRSAGCAGGKGRSCSSRARAA
jgi:ribosomal protein S11